MTARAVPEDLLVGLRRARDRIDLDYAEALDLDGLAAVAGLSKYHFLRCFARTYGLTPHAYLTERRVERAQDLLRATNLTVTEVWPRASPAGRPYGVEAVMRDNSGNWLVLVEPRVFTPADFG